VLDVDELITVLRQVRDDEWLRDLAAALDKELQPSPALDDAGVAALEAVERAVTAQQ